MTDTSNWLTTVVHRAGVRSEVDHENLLVGRCFYCGEHIWYDESGESVAAARRTWIHISTGKAFCRQTVATVTA